MRLTLVTARPNAADRDHRDGGLGQITFRGHKSRFAREAATPAI